MHFSYILWNRARGILQFPRFRPQVSAAVRSGAMGAVFSPEDTFKRGDQLKGSPRAWWLHTDEANRVHARHCLWAEPCPWVGGPSDLRQSCLVWPADGGQGLRAESGKLGSAISHGDNHPDHPLVLCLLGGHGHGKQHLVASLAGKIYAGRMLPVLLCGMYPSTQWVK